MPTDDQKFAQHENYHSTNLRRVDQQCSTLTLSRDSQVALITSAGVGTGERPGTGARRPSSPEPAASWSLSPGVRAYLRCALRSENTGAPQRDLQVREVRMEAGGLSLILPRNRPRSRRGILTNGKRAMASQRRRKGEKESRVEIEEPFRSRFEM